MKILYFASLRTKIGKNSEIIAPPATVNTVESLIAWLNQQGPEYDRAFSDRPRVRVAVNQTYVPFDQVIGPDDEVAFFPPVTGG